MLLEKVK